jgi:hypothetical protein
VESIQNVNSPTPTALKGYNLIIWPYGYSYYRQNNIIQVRDEKGQPWAWEGDFVFFGGGGIPSEMLKQNVDESLFPQEPGPYWLASPSYNTHIIVQPPNTQIQSLHMSEMEGLLVKDQKVLCFKTSEKQYTPIFPHGYSIRWEIQTELIYKDNHEIVTPVGSRANLKGYEISSEEVKSLYGLENLPSVWQEPFWLVSSFIKVE